MARDWLETVTQFAISRLGSDDRGSVVFALDAAEDELLASRTRITPMTLETTGWKRGQGVWWEKTVGKYEFGYRVFNGETDFLVNGQYMHTRGIKSIRDLRELVAIYSGERP